MNKNEDSLHQLKSEVGRAAAKCATEILYSHLFQVVDF